MTATDTIVEIVERHLARLKEDKDKFIAEARRNLTAANSLTQKIEDCEAFLEAEKNAQQVPAEG